MRNIQLVCPDIFNAAAHDAVSGKIRERDTPVVPLLPCLDEHENEHADVQNTLIEESRMNLNIVHRGRHMCRDGLIDIAFTHHLDRKAHRKE